jgi:hypothetical protein
MRIDFLCHVRRLAGNALGPPTSMLLVCPPKSDDVPPAALMAGKEQSPTDWVKQRSKRLGEKWIVVSPIWCRAANAKQALKILKRSRHGLIGVFLSRCDREDAETFGAVGERDQWAGSHVGKNSGDIVLIFRLTGRVKID